MMLYKRYLIKKFIRNFILISTQIISLFIILGLVTNLDYFKSIPTIGIFYYILTKTVLSIYLLFPVILLITYTVTLINLISSNYLVTLYSLGYSRKNIFKIFFKASAIIIFIFSLIHLTPLSKYYVYSFEFNPTIDGVFFNNNNNYYYINKYQLDANIGKNITMFDIKDREVNKIVTADQLKQSNDRIILKNLSILTIPKDINFNQGINIYKKDKNYINNIPINKIIKINKNLANFSTIEIINSIFTNGIQSKKLDQFVAYLYFFTIFPFFTIFIFIFIFRLIPLNNRLNNIVTFTLKGILISILSWGFMHILIQFSIYSNISLTVNFIVLIIISLYSWYTHKKTFIF